MNSSPRYSNFAKALCAAGLLLLGGALAHGALRVQAQSAPNGFVTPAGSGAYVLQNGRLHFCRLPLIQTRRIADGDVPPTPVCSEGVQVQ